MVPAWQRLQTRSRLLLPLENGLGVGGCLVAPVAVEAAEVDLCAALHVSNLYGPVPFIVLIWSPAAVCVISQSLSLIAKTENAIFDRNATSGLQNVKTTSVAGRGERLQVARVGQAIPGAAEQSTASP